MRYQARSTPAGGLGLRSRWYVMTPDPPHRSLTFHQSALLPDANSLVKLSSHILTTRPSTRTPIPFPGCPHSSDLDTLDALEFEDTKSIQELHADLVKICTRAQERGVKIIIDAEYRFVLSIVKIHPPISNLFVAGISRLSMP